MNEMSGQIFEVQRKAGKRVNSTGQRTAFVLTSGPSVPRQKSSKIRLPDKSEINSQRLKVKIPAFRLGCAEFRLSQIQQHDRICSVILGMT